MKNIFFFLFPLFFVMAAVAQDPWAHVGAIWTYKNGGWCNGLVHIRSIRDTIISGKPCRIMRKDCHTCDERLQDEYMYSDSGRVYFYEPSCDAFSLLFDINANPGEH